MNKTTAEWCKAAIVLLLAFLLVDANERNVALKEEKQNLIEENKKLKAEYPTEWEDTRKMFHILASENYRLNGQAKQWLPRNMVIPQEDIDHLLKNGWSKPGDKDAANVPNQARR